MAKYEQYAEYKDSGVEWLGKVPSHWDIIKGGYIGELFGSEAVLESHVVNEGDLPFVKVSTLSTDSFNIDSPEWFVSRKVDRFIRTQEDYIVFPKRGAAIFTNKVNIVNIPSVIDPNLMGWKVNEKAINKYIALLLKTRRLDDIADVSTVPQINNKHINPQKFPLPPIEEQKLILNFLDFETAQIDTLIEKQQTLIQLLKEKRQAVISHAVTKGLNPDAPMKDSGVEWLGEVPEHWEVKRIKHYGKIMGGFAFKSDDFIDSGYPVLKISNVSHLQLNFDDESFLPLSFVEKHLEYKVEENDLVFAMTRPIISGGIKVAKIPKLEAMPLVNQRVGFLKLKSELLADFILYSSLSSSFKAQFKNNMTITNQPNISGEGIESVALPMPPKNELVEIVDFLNNSETVFQNLSIKSEQQVELLKERRTALISAAVTGKIDVRG